MNLRSVIELTPLLDVFLIIIFGFMINHKGTSDEKQLEVEMKEHEISLLKLKVEEKQEEISQYRKNLDSSQIRIARYEQELESQKVLLYQTLERVEKKMSLFFREAKSKQKKEKLEGKLAAADYQNFAERLEKMITTPSENFIEQLYVLEELNAYATTISIYLDTANQIWIDHKPSGAMLKNSDFDEKTGDFAPEKIEIFKKNLTEKLKNLYNDRKKGTDKMGEIVLLTFGHSNKAMRGVISISKKLTENFYKETLRTEGQFRKILYADLGFYPFAPKKR